MGWFARPALDPKQQAEKEAKAVQELRALLLQSPEVATQLVQGVCGCVFVLQQAHISSTRCLAMHSAS
jgi:hypothetical protein